MLSSSLAAALLLWRLLAPAGDSAEATYLAIVDPDGKPLNKVRALGFVVGQPGPVFDETSDANGRVALGAAMTAARLLLFHPDYLPKETELSLASAKPTTVRLERGTRMEVEAVGPRRAETRRFEARLFKLDWLGVIDVESLPPFAVFEQFARLPAAQGFFLDIASDGLESLRLPAQGKRRVILQRGETLLGRLRLTALDGNEPVVVRLIRLPDHPQKAIDVSAIRVAFASKDGSFRIPGVNPFGSLSLLVEPRLGAPLWHPLQPRELSRPLVLDIARGSSAKGTVRCEGLPPRTSSVRAFLRPRDARDLTVKRAVSYGENSTFVVHGLSPGVLRLVISVPDSAETEARYTIGSDTREQDLGTICPQPPVELRGVVRSEDEKPLEGADIVFEKASTRSQKDGKFLLAVTGPPRGELRVSKPGLLPWTRNLALGSELPGFAVTLHAGATVRGKVVDSATKEPIRSFSLSIYHRGRAAAPLVENDLAPSDGRFESRPVDPGAYRLFISAPGFVQSELPFELSRSGETRDLGSIALAAGFTVSGRALSPSGEPAYGARGVLRPVSSQPYDRDSEGYSAFSATTAQDGQLRLIGIRPGDYTLSLKASSFAEFRRPVTVGADMDLGDLYLDLGCKLDGRVGDRFGKPAPYMSIEARRGSPQELRSAIAASSDADGFFSFEHLARDVYSIVVRSNRRTLTSSQVSMEGDPCARTTELVVGGTEVEGYISLRGEPAAYRQLTASRKLVRRPGSFAVILRIPDENGENVTQEILGEGSDTVFTETDRQGYYALSQMEAGEYQFVLQNGGRQLIRTVSIPGVPQARIDLDFGGRRIEGSVADAKTGTGIGAARISLFGQATDRPLDITVTDDTGLFTFSDVGETRLTLSASRPGYRSTSISVDASDSMLITRRVALEPLSLKVTGHVYDDRGAAIPNAILLWLIDAPLSPRAGQSVTAASGAFELTDLEPGTLRVLAVAPGLGASVHALVLDPAQTNPTLEIMLAQPVVLKALLDPEDQGGQARVLADGGDITFLLLRAGIRAMPEVPGTLVWRGLGAGSYTVSIGAKSKTVSPIAGSETTIDLRSGK